METKPVNETEKMISTHTTDEAKAPASTVTPTMVDSWWQSSTKRSPRPDERACVRMAAQIDLCRVTGPTNRSKAAKPAPIAEAMEAVKTQAARSREHWQKVLADAPDDDEAKLALRYAERLLQALTPFSPDLLGEPVITVSLLSWQAHALFIRDMVFKEWTKCGQTLPKPHAKSPPIVFIALAVSHFEPVPVTGAAAYSFLRKQALKRV